MSIILTDTLQRIRPTKGIPTQPTVTVICDGPRVTLRLTRAAIRAMGLEVDKGHRIHIDLSRTRIALTRADANDADTWTIQSKGEVMAHDLRTLLQLKDGERFAIPVEPSGAGIEGPLPDAVITRINMAARKLRLADGAAA